MSCFEAQVEMMHCLAHAIGFSFAGIDSHTQQSLTTWHCDDSVHSGAAIGPPPAPAPPAPPGPAPPVVVLPPDPTALDADVEPDPLVPELHPKVADHAAARVSAAAPNQRNEVMPHYGPSRRGCLPEKPIAYRPAGFSRLGFFATFEVGREI
jgi:hypothetical protein